MNTKNILIAERYAEALVEIAKDGTSGGKLTYSKIGEDLNLIKEILMQSKDLNDVLINPIVSAEKKKEIVDKVFSDEVDFLIINLLKVMIDKDRFSVFSDVLDAYNKSLDGINNISRVNVTSAVEMSAESQDKLKHKLEEKLRKSVVLDLDINSDIIAGLVIKIGDNIIDMSLKHKLEDLSKNIMK